MKIEDIGNNNWNVTSDSGNTYRVQMLTKIARDSGSMYFAWKCNCPARKTCKHIRAIEEMSESVDEQASERIA